ncbi:AAA family ATPase [Salegentibacter maritimus]|uniref:AAA family ATPase n=1 Tax=Salegentibacter maritimus TaxID=2794347 RepID=UPI0018E4799E|nr:AAA family ATPase [Salegentibacter maritimus]MBI6115991.1 AAA family ATPase [Salegentibacter maritimus]
MFIKSIKLKNFQSYYGDKNEIEFTEGLNIIAGSIASGKSKLFDAFYWVLNDKIFVTGKDWVSTKNLGISFVNDKAKYESNDIDDLIETSVKIVVKNNNEKRSSRNIDYTIKRQFLIRRKELSDCFSTGNWNISPSTLTVEYVDPKTSNTEIAHNQEARELIETLFPSKISPYIWFQGEALDKLIDFDNKGTIRRAIDYISYVPLYKVMNNIISEVDKKISNRARKEVGKLSTDIKRYEELSREIEVKNSAISNNKKLIEEKSKTLGEREEQLEEVETALAALVEFPALNEEKREVENDIETINQNIENLDIKERKKFSSLWMLYGSKHLFQKAGDKLIEFEDYRQSLINKEYKLPEDVPGDVYLNKMLEKEICLICDRPAEENSEAWNNIKAKLNRKHKPEYLSEENEKINKEVLTFKAKLAGLSRNYGTIQKEILDHREKLDEAYEERNIYKEKLQTVNDEIDRLYTKRGIDISEGAQTHRKKHGEYKTLNEVIRNLNRKIEGMKASIKDAEMDIGKLEGELNKIQRTNEDVKVVEEEIAKYTKYLSNHISEIEKKEYDKLIDQIESEANLSFTDITSVNNTIDGFIKIDRDTFRVLNVDHDGRELENYNTGHHTLMKMCIINAIISLTNDYKDASYPFITDAPTSNLDDKATFAYLESISNTFNQSIVITKDIAEDEIDDIKNKEYVTGLFHLKIKNDTGNEIMDRKDAYTQISSIKN